MILLVNAFLSDAQEVQVIAPPKSEARASHNPGLLFLTVRLTETVSSEGAKIGQIVSLEVVEPVQLDGKTIIAADAHAEAIVKVAKRAGWNDRPGQLVLTATTVDRVDGKRQAFPPFVTLRGSPQPVSAYGRCIYPTSDNMLSLFRMGESVALLKGAELTIPIGWLTL